MSLDILVEVGGTLFFTGIAVYAWRENQTIEQRLEKFASQGLFKTYTVINLLKDQEQNHVLCLIPAALMQVACSINALSLRHFIPLFLPMPLHMALMLGSFYLVGRSIYQLYCIDQEVDLLSNPKTPPAEIEKITRRYI